MNALADEPLDPALLLSVTLSDQVSEQLAEVEVSGEVGVTLQCLVADGALVLSINDFQDAFLAESVSALRDVGIVEGLEADYALRKLSNDLIDADLHRLVVLGSILLEAGLPLGQLGLHNDIYHFTFIF